MTFIERIDALLSENKITAKQMLSDLSLNKNAVGYWRRGTIPNDSTLLSLAKYFDVSPEYLKGETDVREPTTSDAELAEYLQELKTRPEMKMLFSLAKGATKEDVEKAVKIIEAYLGK